MRIQQQNREALNHDTFDSLAYFLNKLKDTVLPSGCFIIFKENTVSFHYIHCSDVATTAPQQLISVVVLPSFAFHVFANSVLVPLHFFRACCLLVQ